MAAAPEPGQESPGSLILTVGAGVGVFALGFVGLGLVLGFGDVGDLAYRALQLFVLDGGALAGQDGTLPINGWLQAARFLAPAVTIMAILLGVRSLFAEERRRRRIAGTTGHTVVCGDNAAALVLAQNLRAAGRAVVLVAGAERPDTHLPTVVGDPRDVAVLRAAGARGAAAVYALAERSATNAAVALAAASTRAGSTSRLATFAQVRTDELVEALRLRRMAAHGPSTVTMDFFALDEIAARVLLAEHPCGDGTPVIVGFGELGRAVLKTIVRRPGPSRPSRVVVVGDDETAVRDEARRLGAERRGWEVTPGRPEDGDGPVYVCLVDEDEAVATGLRLAREAEQSPVGSDVVVCLQRASPFREALTADGRLEIFGVLDAACTENAIADDSIVARTARAIHERYLAGALARGESEQTNPSAVPWDRLPAHLRESNHAQAEHIGAKLTAIGASLTTRPPRRGAEFAFTPSEITELAVAEHDRWRAEREAAGFRYGPTRQGMDHPDLVDWTNLPESSQDKDISTVCDLPELLADEDLYIRREGSAGR